ncbi:hypothetical protein JMM81_10665 [Bacillus sp. V3B]|uniref:hypothetical protein n=1 Tax=Bacillus sp. V3B TaxID=2804915 RepID=UPI00210EDFB4|nr:hypothetical protein [Bacillus sp. V3B]MCQ6275421.1 hypothetical protein [Bacillus sp. V3B]
MRNPYFNNQAISYWTPFRQQYQPIPRPRPPRPLYPLFLPQTQPLAYQCTGLKCSCVGDADCNDMFLSGKCGDVAQCWETPGGGVYCECLRV